jgi:hypothetical protein
MRAGLKLRRELFLCALILACGTTTARAQGERPRQARTPPSAEVTITLGEQFFNSFLDEVFTDLRAPSYRIAAAPQGKDERQAQAAHSPVQCESVVVLEREMDGVRTAVKFEEGRILAPMAFSGTYQSTLLGCLKFQGWAETRLNLEFDRARQVLNARVEVLDVHLSNIPGAASSLLAGMVQKAIDQRINPVELIQAAQLSTRVPVAAAGGAVRLRAKEVRPDIKRGELQLHIIYEFVRAD